MYFTVVLNGGLGNQLFQLAHVYALSKKNNCKFLIDIPRMNLIIKNIWNRNTYWNTVFHNFKRFNHPDLFLKFNSSIIKVIETSFLKNKNKISNYDRILDNLGNIKDNICFNGFFQNYKYIDLYKDKLISLFAPPDDIKLQLINLYNYISSISKNKYFISVHIRRGDYLNNNEHPNLSKQYYYNAINKMNKNYVFLFFSDDIEWCKLEFSDFDINKYFIDIDNEYLEFYLMTLCKHNIIANSSFSWWAAYLNTNKNKAVIMPDPWFGPQKKNYTSKGLYYPSWIIVEDKVLLTKFMNYKDHDNSDENSNEVLDNINKAITMTNIND